MRSVADMIGAVVEIYTIQVCWRVKIRWKFLPFSNQEIKLICFHAGSSLTAGAK